MSGRLEECSTKIKILKYNPHYTYQKMLNRITTVRVSDMIDCSNEHEKVLDKDKWIIEDDLAKYSRSFYYEMIDVLECDSGNFNNKFFRMSENRLDGFVYERIMPTK